MGRYKTRGRYRAFREEFVDHMQALDAWPDHVVAADLLRRMKRPTKREHISALRRGAHAPAHYANDLIEMLLADPDGRVARERSALIAYLRERGFEDVGVGDLPVVLSQVCTPPTRQKPESLGEPAEETFRNPIAYLATLPVVALYKRYIAGVGAGDALTVARWTYVRAGQDMTPEGQVLDEQSCIRAAEQIIGLPLTDCAKRFARLAEHEPWSVLLTHKGRTRLGASVAVPVTPGAYAQIRAGTLSLLDLSPDHVRCPSDHIAFVAIAENPELMAKGVDPTEPMFITVAAQYAALMRCSENGRATRYRVIAPEGTPKNRDRMLAGQFRALGTFDPRNQSRLWEREFDVASGVGLEPIEEVVLRRLGREAPRTPPRGR